MRRPLSLLCLSLAAFLLLTALPGCGDGQRTAGSDLEAKARKLVESLAAGDYATSVESFDAVMRDSMPAEELRRAWDSLEEQAGSFQSITGTRVEQAGDYEAVYVTCDFEDTPIDIKVVYDRDRKVSGLFFEPVREAFDYETPTYVDTASFSEREVTVECGQWPLPGTISLPAGEGPFPGLVLVHGSGPNDRDESLGPISPFKDLAWGLASRGIAVLRYDKRTLVYNEEIAAGGRDITVEDEVVDDAAAAVDLLRSTQGVDPEGVFVLGHSLGGMLIPRIAAASPEARGFVILAGAARPLEDLILEQTEYIVSLDGEITSDEQELLDQLRKVVATVKGPDLAPDTPGSELPLGMSGRYWLDLRGYDPAEEARGISRPILVLQGERDYQVTMEDFALWEAALSGMPGVTLKTYPDLNHLFVTGTGKSTPDEYQVPGHVSGEVIDDIAAFIEANR